MYLIVGVYLGYPKHHKYRVFTTSLSEVELRRIESACGDADSLAKQLFTTLFKEELASRPDSICCTKNREDREVLNQELLNGIRCEYRIQCSTTGVCIYIHTLVSKELPLLILFRLLAWHCYIMC